MVRLGMQGVCYQFCMRMHQDGNWKEYSVVQSPGRYSVDI